MRNFEDFSDKELSILLFQGDSGAFEEIFNRYWSDLYSAAFKRVKNHEVAEEIVQDLFTLVWTKRANIQIHSSLGGYLFTAIRYMVLNYIQKEVVRDNYRQSLKEQAFYHNSTEETVFFNDLTRTIENQVHQLPPKCRSVFELSRKQHKTNREIAEVLGISEKTVEGHLTKALRHLKLNLSDLSRLASWFF